MTTRTRAIVAPVFLIVLVAGGAALLKWGKYGFTVFVVAPVLIGALAAWVVAARTAKRAACAGMIATLVATCSLLAVGWEGLLCTLMALPLSLPLGALGGWLTYRVTSSKAATPGIAMALLIPLASLGWDVTAAPPIFEVQSRIEINAPPEQVWKHVVTVSELPEPTEWLFRAGIAYPQRARIAGSGVGAIRYCDFSTGPFVEPIEVWDEPRLLRFAVTANPAPMHEWSPYGNVMPKHLHGYFISRRGQFRLTPLENRRTLLEGTSWYQHGLWPAGYWRWWSDAIIHRIHMRVLTHIRTLAEKEVAAEGERQQY